MSESPRPNKGANAMKEQTEADLLRIFVGESDRCDGKCLYEAIMHRAQQRGMSGATVLHGTLGFGAHNRVHTAKILRLSEDLPVVVEIVDKPERIAEFLPELDKMIGEGLVTLEKVRVMKYRQAHLLRYDNSFGSGMLLPKLSSPYPFSASNCRSLKTRLSPTKVTLISTSMSTMPVD